MRKLALSDEILLSVQQPARYIGDEVNMRIKDLKKADIRSVTCFLDVYEIGMSHLGIQILYSTFNNRENIYCERVYSSWTDLGLILGENKISLFTLETQEPVKNFDFPGVTLQYEMCCTNVLQILDLSQIPLHTCDRTENSPIVIGGGPCVYNSEPLADFLDLFYIGEGETVYFKLTDRYKESKKAGGTRKRFLERVVEIPGIYVPTSYDVTYKKDGTIEYFRPNNEHTMPMVTKRIVLDMDSVGYIEKPLMPSIKVTQDRVVLEIQCGRIRSCRFCQARDVYRPLREHSLEYLKHYAHGTLRSTGYEEISLSPLSSSDYNQLEGLTNFLINEFKGKGVNISLPSLYIDAFSLDVMSKAQDVKKSSLTLAPEAGSQRLRGAINKGLTEEMTPKGVADAFELGWNWVKLYFILGLPTETVEDVEGIALFSEKIAEAYYDAPRDQRDGKVQVAASSPFFVPKSFMPFWWARVHTKEEFIERVDIVRDKFREMKNFKSLKYNWHEAEPTALEGVLTRGDRRVGAVIEETYRIGAIYDSRLGYSRDDVWIRVLETCGVDIGFYITRERSLGEVFPWDFTDADVSKESLICEWNRAVKEEVTPNCRQRCSGCGARDSGYGVCYETVKE